MQGTNVPISLSQVNPNTTAAGHWTQHLTWHQAATQNQADWNSVCPRKNLGVHTAPRKPQVEGGPSAGHFEPLGDSPIHKPSNTTSPSTKIKFMYYKNLRA